MNEKRFSNPKGWLIGLVILVVLMVPLLFIAIDDNKSVPSNQGATTSPPAGPTTGSTAAPGPTPSVTPEITTAPTQALVKSIKTQLDESWTDYSKRFIQADGRVMDPYQEALTTSEGQSYALLRAVWQNDRETFKRVLAWTQSNLQTRGTDKLFAFKWGKSDNGQWHVLDKSSASDADSDIALALLFAGKIWSDDTFHRLGIEVLNSIWDKSVLTLNSKPYLTAGDWAPAQERPALNPSYLSPYAYRIFATFDKAHKWGDLVDTSYEVIQGCSKATLAGLGGKNLAPNFCGINKQDGTFTTAQDYPSLNTNYGYDAFRTHWRLALDYKWFGEKRALDYLTASNLPRELFKQNNRLDAEYDHSGKVITPGEDLAVYAGTLGNFMATDPALAQSLVNSKLLPTYKKVVDNDFARAFSGWGDTRNYYNQNWVWFGLALYSDNLPNLAAGQN